jgi:hypothetical protein
MTIGWMRLIARFLSQAGMCGLKDVLVDWVEITCYQW